MILHCKNGIRVVSPVGRFARGLFRPGSFRPCFRDGSIRPYYVSRFARRSFRPLVVSPIVFIEGHTDSLAGYLNHHHTSGTVPSGCMGQLY